MAIPSSLSLVQLHSGQMQVFQSPHRFKVVCAGRRWGKSRLSISTIIRAAAKEKKQRVWYVAPTYQMARQILWDDLQEVLPRKWVRKKNDTTMTIVLKNGSEIALKGADKPDTLRGVALHFVVLDEFQDMKPDPWRCADHRYAKRLLRVPQAVDYRSEQRFATQRAVEELAVRYG